MSLEQSLQNIADALNNLAAAVQGKGQLPIDLTKGQHSEATAGKPQKADKPTKSEPKAESPKTDAKPEGAATQPTAEAPATAPAEKAASSVKPLDYAKDIQEPFLKVVGTKGRDAAKAIIEHFKPGAPKLSAAIDVNDQAQLAEALALINKALSE